jgi:hypothetical protein
MARLGVADERIAADGDLEIITRMLGPSRPTYQGRRAQLHDAIHQPKGPAAPHPDCGGVATVPRVTWRLAARFADELCLDALPPDAVAKALPVIRARCEEIDRDPAGLRVAVHLWGEPAAVAPGRRGKSGWGSTPTSASTGWSSRGSRPAAVPTIWTRWWRTAPPSGCWSRPGPRAFSRPAGRRLGQRWITVQVRVRVTPSTSWMREATSLPS